MNRRWFFWVLALAFVYLFISRFAQVEALARTVANGRLGWIAGALAAEGIYFILYASIYKTAFATVDVQSNYFNLLPLTFSSYFDNLITPGGSIFHARIIKADAIQHDQPATRVSAGTLLVLLAVACAFSLILTAGIWAFSFQRTYRVFELTATVLLLFPSIILTILLLLGLRNQSFLNKLLKWTKDVLDILSAIFKRPSIIQENWIDRTSGEFSAASLGIRSHPFQFAATLFFGLLSQLANLVCLYLLFLAFSQRILPGVLVAGYGMGILFWIVSITPQGIGVVEGGMALVFAALAIPSPIATIVALSFRAISFWLPGLVGFVLISQKQAARLPTDTQVSTDIFSVRAAAVLTGLMGLVNLVSAVTPNIASRLTTIRQFVPLDVRNGSHLASVLAGFALLLLADNLRRRKRIAWALTVVVLFISAISHLLKGLDVEEAAISLFLAAWLLTRQAHFHARSDPASTMQGVKILGAAILFSLAYGVAGLYFMDRNFTVRFHLFQAFEQTIVMFTQFYDPGLMPIPVTRFGRYFADSIFVVGAGTIGYALIMLVRPVLVHHPATLEDREQAAKTIEQYGATSLAHFTLFEDKSYFFSRGGSVIAYVVKGRIALTLGDPIGPPADFLAILVEFRKFCTLNDWEPAFYQVQPDGLPAYQKLGYATICIGHEAIVDLTTFTLEGKQGKPLRVPVNHMKHLGYTSCVYIPPIQPEILEELHQISDTWLTQVHGMEKRFSLGWFDDEYIRGSTIITIENSEKQIAAFANIVPEYQRNEVGVDLMRRIDRENGTMEYLFVSMFQWAIQNSYDSFNLGLSALAGVGEHSQDHTVEKALHYVYEHINQFYNFKGLHSFKEKFNPTWSPRFLVYPGNANLLAVVMALVRADSGDDFLFGYLKK